MRIFRSLDDARHEFAPSAVTIGNFDGVHLGHRELMRRVRRLAHEGGLKASVLTFHPHPTQIVAPERAPKLLSTPDERCDLLRAESIRQVLILPFHPGIASLSPEDFFRQILVETLGAKAVTVGDSFLFGRHQSGSVRDLERLGARYGVRIELVPPVRLRGVTVSSSAIRALLAAGNVSKAARLLGRPYALAGNVIPGEGRGRKETVPTLNLDTPAEALPETGVYVTRTEDMEGHRRWNSVTNVGYRPTFEGRNLTVESFLLGALEEPAPERIRVEFLRRVRAERRFDSAAELKSQILRDARTATEFFRRAARLSA